MNKRLLNLDFLRGIFVFLALQEHFIHYLNSTFIYYYDNYGLAPLIQAFYKSYEGNLLPLSSAQITALFIFVPWVSHGYIALASFNLAKRQPEDLKDILGSKLKVFLTIALFFFIESFIVATDFGEALTIHPLFIWMILLSLLAIVYSYFRITGVILLYLLSFLITFILKDLQISAIIESMVQTAVHADFAYDARIESFFITSVSGFIIGYLYYHIKHKFKSLALFSLFQIIMAIILGFSIFQIDPINMENTFRQETVYYSQLGNLFFIQFILSSIILLMLWLEEKAIVLKSNFLYFISINSIFVFAVHKLFFTKIIIPLRLYLGYLLDIPYNNTYLASIIYTVLTVAFVWCIKKIRLVEILTKTERS